MKKHGNSLFRKLNLWLLKSSHSDPIITTVAAARILAKIGVSYNRIFAFLCGVEKHGLAKNTPKLCAF
jgi:hypothetical protein